MRGSPASLRSSHCEASTDQSTACFPTTTSSSGLSTLMEKLCRVEVCWVIEWRKVPWSLWLYVLETGEVASP